MKTKTVYTAQSLLEKLTEVGDAVVDYINSVGKTRYAVVTVDFTTPYVLNYVLGKEDLKLIDGNLLTVFSWDASKLIRLDAEKIKQITPLSEVINGVHRTGSNTNLSKN